MAFFPKPQLGRLPAPDDGGVIVGAIGETAPESTISFKKGSKPLMLIP
tara:strand:+ start:316 stop:459 length:144 start_codon:yes stop_codon:yes gene_type:complete